MTKSDALIESKSLRETVIERVDALEKVKKLIMLPGDIHASVEMVSEYFEVSRKAIDSLIFDNRDELSIDGVRVLRGDELFSLKEMGLIGKTASSFTIIPRRAILRIGMLLRDSQVARAIRDYLLESERDPYAGLSPEMKAIFIQDKKYQQLDNRVDQIERKVDEQITLDHGEQRRLQKTIAKRVYKLANLPEYRRPMFREIHREIKDRWGVGSYTDVKRKELQQVLGYVENWIPKIVGY
ncbi:ORF6C domain-containing protein [Paenibacillus gansuensis]|uniref:ORF6C domain-containing protein n=1 Tax=Paenibacillus gansuensis TaxID=306542 RepID=A0ABW5PEJ3_9BACL